MTDDAMQRRATALDATLDASAGTTEAATGATPTPADLEPDERAMVDRIRSVLAHPAVWMEPPDLPVHPVALETPSPLGADEPATDPAGGPATSPAGRPATSRAGAPGTGRRRGRRRLLWGLGAAVAAGVAAAVFAVTVLLAPHHETVRFELAGGDLAPRAHASVTATKLDAGWHVTLEAGDLPGAPEGTYYQGWVVRGSAYVPLGTFHLRQPGKVELWAGVPVDEYTRLEVTRQRVGGGQAPGELVLVGQIPAR
jgi:hypothetical protein